MLRPRHSRYLYIDMKRQGTDILYFEVGKENEPTLFVDPGEEFEVLTQMNKGPWIEDRPNREELEKRLTSGNPSSGCIYVNGAEPGKMLSVSIGQINLGPIGYTRFSGSNGAMPAHLGSSAIGDHWKIVEIHEGKFTWSDNLTLEAKPMLGFVGVSPANERIRNNWGGYWGGNFDIQEVTTGATVHLPVMVPGALLHIGDMHAIQGDGEICGAGGIEAEGTAILTCAVTDKPESMEYPRIENESHIIAVGMAKPAEDAFRMALENLILWMEEDYGFTRAEAFLLLGQVLEARCTQYVNPTYTYVAKIAKRYLPAQSR